MHVRPLLVVALSLLSLAACGSSSSTLPRNSDGGGNGDGGGGGGDGAGGDANPPRDAAGDAIPPADGPIPCGTTTCDPTAFCINPCCGGFRPPCVEPDDGGGCPSGTMSDSTCQGSGSPPGATCRPDPCTPPPPYCSPTPECGPGGPVVTPTGHSVSCACA